MRVVSFLIFILFLGCANKKYYNEPIQLNTSTKKTQKPYYVRGRVYYPLNKVYIGWSERGIASWYGPNFHGRYTSSGEVYNMYAYTAAHKTLPMNTIVKVINLNNNKSVIVRINDRGPFIRGRIIDLSYAAGKKIGLDVTGTAPVKIVVVGFKGKNYISGYKVQVGAFLKKSGAKKLSQKYQKLGYNTVIVQKDIFYKVYISGFRTYKEAKKFMLKNKISGFVVGD